MPTKLPYYKKAFIAWLSGTSLLIISSLWANIAQALPETNNLLLAQNTPIPPQDIDPREPLEPPAETPPEPPSSPEDLLPTPSETAPAIPPEVLAEEITVTNLSFDGNTLFSSEDLETRLLEKLTESQEQIETESEPRQVWTERILTISELLQLAAIVAKIYQDEGYDTSGAIVRIPEITQQERRGEIVIQVIEGSLESVELTTAEGSSSRLNRGYVRSRLDLETGEPLNVDKLQERLQLLQLDPLIGSITAELNAGPTTGTSLLTVEYEEAPTFDAVVNLNNGRSPSVGSFQRQLTLGQSNLLGFGDSVSVGYANSDGSDTLNASYTIPLNAADGTLDFSYSKSWNDVIEEPFDDVDNDGSGPDIESTSQTYEITLRQPIIRSIQNRTFQELAIGLTTSFRESESFLLDEPFPLSPGAEADGETKVFALRFFQDWTRQDAKQVIALRSQFTFGLDGLGSTINNSIPGVEPIPDSRFFSWRGQAQWVRLLGTETLLVLRGNAQFADQALLSSEQFGIGGFGSVRGYRQDQLLTDNGLFGSAEVRFPIMRVPEWNATLKLAPFFDIGTAWESTGLDNPDPNTLASLGLGLQWEQGNDFTARLDFGIPLVSVESTENTWQENGLYFSLIYNPF